MSDIKDTTLKYLSSLDLSRDEAKLYLALLKSPQTHLELARVTGVNRTKVYRLADQLEKRSLISSQTDDRGTFLVAADPSTLEVELVTQEETLKNKRAIFKQLLPTLTDIKKQGASGPLNFIIHTYEGVEGFKQMLWHELKAKNEVLVFGSGAIENLVPSKRWAEKHRAMSVEAAYKVRELLNPGKKGENFTKNTAFMKAYSKRYITEDILLMDHQIVVYNDTVATYCWQDGQKVGYEIINKAYATMLRQMFESYWQLSK